MKETLSLKSNLTTLFQRMNESEHTLSVEVADICVKFLNELNSLKQVSHADIANRTLKSFEKYTELEEVKAYNDKVTEVLENFSLAAQLESINNNLKVQNSPVYKIAIETLNKLEEMSNEDIKANKHLIREHRWINSIAKVSNELDGIIAESNSLTQKGTKRNLISPAAIKEGNILFFAGNTIFSINEERDLFSIKTGTPDDVDGEFMKAATLIKEFNLQESGSYHKYFKNFKVSGNFESGKHFINDQPVKLEELKNTSLTKGSSIEDLGLLEAVVTGEKTFQNVYVMENAFQLVEGSKVTTYFHKENQGISIEYDMNENVSYTKSFTSDELVESFMKERNIDISEEFSVHFEGVKAKKFKIKDAIVENTKKLSFLKDKIDDMSMVRQTLNTPEINEAILTLQMSAKEIKEANQILEKSIQDDGFIEGELRKDLAEFDLKKGQEVMVDALSYSQSGSNDPVTVMMGGGEIIVKKKDLKVQM